MTQIVSIEYFSEDIRYIVRENDNTLTAYFRNKKTGKKNGKMEL